MKFELWRRKRLKQNKTKKKMTTTPSISYNLNGASERSFDLNTLNLNMSQLLLSTIDRQHHQQQQHQQQVSWTAPQAEVTGVGRAIFGGMRSVNNKANNSNGTAKRVLHHSHVSSRTSNNNNNNNSSSNDSAAQMAAANKPRGAISPSVSLFNQQQQQQHQHEHHLFACPSLFELPSSTFSLAPQQQPAKYSRKVFVGGLPPDIDESKSLIQYTTRAFRQAMRLTFFVFVCLFESSRRDRVPIPTLRLAQRRLAAQVRVARQVSAQGLRVSALRAGEERARAHRRLHGRPRRQVLHRHLESERTRQARADTALVPERCRVRLRRQAAHWRATHHIRGRHSASAQVE